MTNTPEKAQKVGKKRYDYFKIGTDRKVRIIDYVRVHHGRYYVAHYDYDHHQYYGPLRDVCGNRFFCSTMDGVARAGGYHYDKHSRAVFCCSTMEGVARAGGYHYDRHSRAVERAMKEFGLERRERS